MDTTDLRRFIRDVPDFPQPGILFRDITPLLANARAFAAAVDGIAAPHLGKVDLVLGVESRGFIVGAPVAYRLGVGFAIARKPGKLPFRTVEESYQLEYGSASLQLHEDALAHGKRVVIVDDLLATGGTALAAIKLAQRLGAAIVGCAFVIELDFLKGRDRLAPVDCTSLIHYE